MFLIVPGRSHRRLVRALFPRTPPILAVARNVPDTT